jgi:hypothetical protein
MPDTQEDIIRLNLAKERQEYQAQQAAQEKEGASEVKRMGWGILIRGILLTLIQLGISWIADAVGATGVGLVVSALCWVAGAGISVILYFLLRPYRDSIKEIRFWINLSLVLNAIPLIDSVPFDLIGIAYAFAKSRSHIVQKIASYAAKAERIAPHIPGSNENKS